ncbi:hypothetical protein APZ20_16770 [Xanthomonas oryzae pv. oryzae]|nr:hypothetical protein APZ20_16770 [Xanthomonas oryzae pv. oryzae]AOS11694.1 hypothetical protein ATY44_16900 [Xanthomonas oryzae pv. oryzae]OMO16687.1 hypothetical protein LMG9585_15690 [Xanthomonas oryzae pv. oryzae]
MAAGIDHLFASRPAEVQAALSVSEDADDRSVAAQAIAGLPPLDAAVKRSVEKTAHDTSVRQWRRHIVDVAPYEEERYSRQGICTTVELFLRAGDQLVLAFHSDANGSSPAAEWRCDLWSPEAAQSHWLDVPANGEMDVPVTRPGEYLIGIGQAYGHCPGVIGLWLRVSEPDRLALPLEPAFGSTLRYARRDDGAAVVHIEDEAHVWSHARLETLPVHGVPAGSALLFASADDVWDVSACSDPATSWCAENTHLHRYFLRLSQGDVLTLELAWAATHFDRPMPLPDQCTGRTQGEVRLFKLVRGPELQHVWASAKAADSTQLTCPADGDDCMELRLFGPPAWRTQPVSSFVDLRLWGAYLQRPHCSRDFALENAWVEDWYQQLMPMPVRAVNKTTALTARRAWPVLGIGMYHASTAVLSALSAPT